MINETEYEKGLERLEKLVDLDPEIGTVEYDELISLINLIEEYEDEYYPMHSILIEK